MTTRRRKMINTASRFSFGQAEYIAMATGSNNDANAAKPMNTGYQISAARRARWFAVLNLIMATR